MFGYSPSRTIKSFRNRFADVSSRNIHRLVITEIRHADEQARLKFYDDSGIEKYQYLATLESRTCDECAHLDERVFYVKDKVEGKNYPLMHPYCRCTTTPYIEGITGGEDRWYRDPVTGQGKWTKDMTFKEWKDMQGIKPVKRLGQLTALSAIQAILPQPKLTRDEERTLKQYISSDSYKINNVLRSGKPLSEEQQNFVNNLDSALSKLPNYRSNEPLQRDYFFMSDNDLEEFIKQMNVKIFEDNGYLSTSKIHYGEGTEQVHFIINNSKTGKDISKYNRAEQEVLFAGNTKFIVKSAYNNHGIFTYVLEEQ